MKSRPTAPPLPKGLRERFLRSPHRLVGLVMASVGEGFALHLCDWALGQVPQTLNGPPVQVRPYVPEPGVPLITITPGTVNPFSGVDGAGLGDGTGGDSEVAGNGAGAPGSGGGDATGGDYSSGGGAVGNSTALGTMLAQPWGSAAVGNAQALGVNPSALAATCVLESGCHNVGGSGSITGAFQMTASTYNTMINAAIAQNPSLVGQIVPGLAGQSDPATQSIAASEYLFQGAEYLQAHGISEPSVLDVRGYYNFGPAAGASLANATDGESMTAVLFNYPQSVLAKNGIKPGETVGQWRASVSAKIGNAARQLVLT